MIHTRLSILKTLLKALDDLCKRAKINTEGFRNILLAVIINDMKEWAEYKTPKNRTSEDGEKLNQILTDFIISHKEFKIERFIEDYARYRNVNIVQNNKDWSRIWDNQYAKYIDNVINSGEVITLPNCVNISTDNKDCIKILTSNNCCDGNIIVRDSSINCQG